MNKTDTRNHAVDAAETVLEKLRRGEALYEASECAAKIGHYHWDAEQDRLQSCSEAYARIFGQSVASAIQAQHSWESLIEQVHPDDRERFVETCRNSRALGSLEFEYRICLHEGEIRHLREIGIYADGGEKSLRCARGIVQDITAITHHAGEFERYRELSRQAEHLADIGHYIYDEDTQSYVYLSEGFARIHGTTVEAQMESVKSFDDDLVEIIDTDRDRVAQAYRHYITTGEDLEIEYRITRADGEQRWLREKNHAKSMHQGWVSRTFGVMQDITRQKEIEAELRYKDVLANQAEAITEIGHFVYDEIADKYQYVSQGLANIYGVDTDFLLHHLQGTNDDMEFVHADDREMVLDFYADPQVDENGYEEWEVEFRMVRPSGEIRWVREIGQTQVIEPGVQERTIGVLIDITAQKQAEQEILDARDQLERKVEERTRELALTIERLEQEIREREKLSSELHFLANHDALTGLPSLRLGRDRIQQALAKARRERQVTAVMYLDLDGFKQVNDDHGHDAGDHVLQVTANRIRAEIRETDTAARIGGDEFLVVLPAMPELDQVQRIAAQLIESVGQKITFDECAIHIGVSIGIAIYPENGTTVDELVNAADRAMYQVKRRGRNDYGFAGLRSGKAVIDGAGRMADPAD